MVEDLILSNLIFNEGYGRKVIPFLRTAYFSDKTDRVLFELIEKHVAQYNKFPDKVTLRLSVDLS